MSSLSLPRVLHQRKTSLELERENFEKFQVSFERVFLGNTFIYVTLTHARNSENAEQPCYNVNLLFAGHKYR